MANIERIEFSCVIMCLAGYVYLIFLHFYNGVDLVNAVLLALEYLKEYDQHKSLYIFLDRKVLGAEFVWKAVQQMNIIIVCGHVALICRAITLFFHNHTQQQDA